MKRPYITSFVVGGVLGLLMATGSAMFDPDDSLLQTNFPTAWKEQQAAFGKVSGPYRYSICNDISCEFNFRIFPYYLLLALITAGPIGALYGAAAVATWVWVWNESKEAQKIASGRCR